MSEGMRCKTCKKLFDCEDTKGPGDVCAGWVQDDFLPTPRIPAPMVHPGPLDIEKDMKAIVSAAHYNREICFGNASEVFDFVKDREGKRSFLIIDLTGER